jgi:hypothetical protein
VDETNPTNQVFLKLPRGLDVGYLEVLQVVARQILGGFNRVFNMPF